MNEIKFKEFWFIDNLLQFVNTNNIEIIAINGTLIHELFYREVKK